MNRAGFIFCSAATIGFGLYFGSGAVIAMGIVFALAAAVGPKFDG